MLNQLLAENPETLKNVQTYFEGLDDYDAPYFMVLKATEKMDDVVSTLTEVVETHEPYSCTAFLLTEDLLLVSIDFEEEEIHALIDDAMQKLTQDNIRTHIAVFHHNCLGKASETFDWANQLLAETIKRSPDESAVAFNDFADKDNWPGLQAYTGK